MPGHHRHRERPSFPGIDRNDGRSSRVIAEIAEQPEAVARVLEDGDGAIAAAARAIAGSDSSYAVIAARGSSDNAARYAQHALGRLCGLPVALATPSLHTVYDAHVHYAGGVAIGISQSGESPDVVAVLDAAREQGRPAVAITNDVKSPLAEAATHVIPLHAGAEESVAATKTYTTSLAAVAALAARIAGDREREHELAAVPDALARQVQRTDGLDEAAAAAAGWRRLAVIGRGANYATAFEAALKIKELARVAAEPASPADFLHGPVAMLEPGFPVLAILPSGPAGPAVREVIDAARERDAELTVIGYGDAAESGERVLAVEPGPEWLSPLCAVVPAQLLAVGAAERRGLDADRPAGLQKVTRTT
jgi:glucosamine--fructose-6-phosphate aminotransferase (isomerizing)